MEGILLYRVCAMPALRADVPAHFTVSANFHTGPPLPKPREQISRIRKARKVILAWIQMPRPDEIIIQLNRFFRCICGFSRCFCSFFCSFSGLSPRFSDFFHRICGLFRSNGIAAFRGFGFCLWGCLGTGFLRSRYAFGLHTARIQTQAQNHSQKQGGSFIHNKNLLSCDQSIGSWQFENKASTSQWTWRKA